MKNSAVLKGLFGTAVVLAAMGAKAQNEPGGPPTNNPPASTSPGSSSTSGQVTPGVSSPNGSYVRDTSAGVGGADPLAMQDKMFLRKAAQGGMAEVRLGQLAVQKASSEEVKKFGQRMVNDHTKLNAAMKPFAEAMGLMPPKGLSKGDQAEYDKLNGLSGTDFDKEYLSFMSKDHHKDMREFSEEEASAGDAGLKDAVAKGLRMIAYHSRMADRLATANGLMVEAAPK